MVSDYGSIANLQYHYVHVATRFANFNGYLKVIDPISKSIILCDIQDSQITRNILVLGHSIIGVECHEPANCLQTREVEKVIESDSRNKISAHPYFEKKFKTTEEVNVRRDLIVNRLKSCRIPVLINLETNELTVADCVKIRPPYESATDYICPTRTILKRIKYLVDGISKGSDTG